jgi:hypothetical protein
VGFVLINRLIRMALQAATSRFDLPLHQENCREGDFVINDI